MAVQTKLSATTLKVLRINTFTFRVNTPTNKKNNEALYNKRTMQISNGNKVRH